MSEHSYAVAQACAAKFYPDHHAIAQEVARQYRPDHQSIADTIAEQFSRHSVQCGILDLIADTIADRMRDERIVELEHQIKQLKDKYEKENTTGP